MKRIICIGNRYVTEDAAGFEVYRYLQKHPLPADVELLDGGLAGLDLIRLIEGMERVVFVDSISGFGSTGEIQLLEASAVAAMAENNFGHASGLPYLLRVLPEVCEGELPQIFVLGMEGCPQEINIEQASKFALHVTLNGIEEKSHSDE